MLTEIATDLHQGQDLLTVLFTGCSGQINARYIKGEDRESVFYDNIQDTISGTQQHALLRNCYFGIATRTGSNGKKEGVYEMPSCWVDIDHTPVNEALKKLRDFPLEPTATVSSGHGIHAYWRFKEPLTYTDIKRLEYLNKQLCAWFGGDTSATDASRILRIPGTFNFKDGEPLPVNTIELNALNAYNVTDFDFLPEYVEPIDDTIQQTTSGDTFRVDVQKYASHYGLKIIRSVPFGTSTLYLLKSCIFAGAHKSGETHQGEAYIGQTVDGKLFYGCHHGTCKGTRTWTEARALISGEDSLAQLMIGRSPETPFGSFGSDLTGTDWPEPVPLPDSLPSVKTLEPEMIPEPFKAWIMDIAERMQCPVDFVAAAAVVSAGSLIGTECCIYPKARDDWYELPNLWGAVIGRPSLLKSPAIAESTKPLKRLAADATREYKDAFTEYEQQKVIHKARRDVLDGQIKKALKEGKDPMSMFSSVDKITPPVEKRYLTQDGTVEKIGELLIDNPRGLLIYRDELAGFLHSLEKQGREGDRAFYTEAWNAKDGFTYDRIGRGTLHVDKLIISVFGAITPGALSEYVSGAMKEGRGDDGLMQRFQVSVYPDASPEWQNVDRYPDTEQKNRAYEIYKILSEERLYSNLTGEPGGLHFDSMAQGLFNEWRTDLEARLRKGDLIPAMESHLAKYRKLVPCLALVFHLIEMADDTATGDVSERAFIQAAAWGEYLESHAVRIYDAAISFDMAAARELLKHILAGEIKDGEAPREIYRHHWAKLATAEDVKLALEILQDYDWLTVNKTVTGGRPSEVILLNPKVKKL